MSKTILAPKQDQSIARSLQSANRFPWKLYQIIKTCRSGAIAWDESGRTVLVRPDQFQRECLDPPNSVFKTKNLGSFVRQLNLYGFHKIQSHQSRRGLTEDQLTKQQVIYRFQNDLFIRGRVDLLHKLHRNIGVRQMKQRCECNQKENEQESGMSKGGSQFPLILPSICHSWSFLSELNPSAKLTSCFEVNWAPLIFCGRPLEVAVKVEPKEMLHESFNRCDLKTASLGSNFESKRDVTLVKKEDFDEIVSVFVEMLRQDPDVREMSLAQMDCTISTAVHDLMRRRAEIIRDYETTRLKRSGSPEETHAETTCLPIHDSSFSFSANASRPIFKVADGHMKNDVKMSMLEQNIHDQCACMDFDNYKSNLAYI